MRSVVLLSVVSALVATTAAAVTPEVNGNPSDIGYTASIASSNPIKGNIRIYAPTTGHGVTVQFDLNNLPATGAPFTYQINEFPVNSTGSCASTGSCLDPYNVGSSKCHPSTPAVCQVGDLSGKHGAVTFGTVTNYGDAYLSVVKDTPAFIGNRSFVVQDANGTRIACANFVFHEGGGLSEFSGSAGPTGGAGGTNATRTGGGAGPSNTAVPSFTPTGAAGVVSVSVVGLLGVLAVGAALL